MSAYAKSTGPHACTFRRSRVIIALDCDCYYVQCARLRDASLSGVPVGITQKYLLVTASYEARALGVGKLMRTSEGKRLCPDMRLVDGEDLTWFRMASDTLLEYLNAVLNEIREELALLAIESGSTSAHSTPHDIGRAAPSSICNGDRQHKTGSVNGSGIVERLVQEEFWVDVGAIVDAACALVANGGCGSSPHSSGTCSALQSWLLTPEAITETAASLVATGGLSSELQAQTCDTTATCIVSGSTRVAAESGVAFGGGDSSTSTNACPNTKTRTGSCRSWGFASGWGGHIWSPPSPTDSHLEASSHSLHSPSTSPMHATLSPTTSAGCGCTCAASTGELSALDQVAGSCNDRWSMASRLAAHLRSRLWLELGFRCSAGIGDSKMISKLAAGVHKPNDQTTVLPWHACAFMAGKPLACLPGVGYSTRHRLQGIGVTTTEAVLQLPPQGVAMALASSTHATHTHLPAPSASSGSGAGGSDASALVDEGESYASSNKPFTIEAARNLADRMVLLCRGIDSSEVTPTGPPSTISVEDSYRTLSRWDECIVELGKLCPPLLLRVDEDCVKYHRAPRTLRVSVRHNPIAPRNYHPSTPSQHHGVVEAQGARWPSRASTASTASGISDSSGDSSGVGSIPSAASGGAQLFGNANASLRATVRVAAATTPASVLVYAPPQGRVTRSTHVLPGILLSTAALARARGTGTLPLSSAPLSRDDVDPISFNTSPIGTPAASNSATFPPTVEPRAAPKLEITVVDSDGDGPTSPNLAPTDNPTAPTVIPAAASTTISCTAGVTRDSVSTSNLIAARFRQLCTTPLPNPTACIDGKRVAACVQAASRALCDLIDKDVPPHMRASTHLRSPTGPPLTQFNLSVLNVGFVNFDSKGTAASSNTSVATDVATMLRGAAARDSVSGVKRSRPNDSHPPPSGMLTREAVPARGLAGARSGESGRSSTAGTSGFWGAAAPIAKRATATPQAVATGISTSQFTHPPSGASHASESLSGSTRNAFIEDKDGFICVEDTDSDADIPSVTSEGRRNGIRTIATGIGFPMAPTDRLPQLAAAHNLTSALATSHNSFPGHSIVTASRGSKPAARGLLHFFGPK